MRLLLILLLLSGNNLYCQTEAEVRKVLSNIQTEEDLNALKSRKPDWKIVFKQIPAIGFSYDSLLFHSPPGDIQIQNYPNSAARYISKTLNQSDIEVCKVQYIYIDGGGRTIEKVNQIQNMIIKQYNAGVTFDTLFKKFNEDANPNGVLDWFVKGQMVDSFDKAVRTKKKGDIFKVNIPENRWHYVVLKLEANKVVKSTNRVLIQLDF